MLPPPYNPELNPAERIWHFLRSHWLSSRMFADLDDVIGACVDACNRFVASAPRTAPSSAIARAARLRGAHGEHPRGSPSARPAEPRAQRCRSMARTARPRDAVAREPVVLDLALPNSGQNRFRAFVFDHAGRPVREASQDIVIERLLAATTGVPATQTVAIKVLDDQERNTLEIIVLKGTPLPADGVTPCRAARTVRAGRDDEIRIELFQLSDDRVRDPELNLVIGIFRIDASDLPEGMSIRKGDPVLVHWAKSEGQTITAEVELPTIGQRFDARNYYNYQARLESFEGEDGNALVTGRSSTSTWLRSAAASCTRPHGGSRMSSLRQRQPLRRSCCSKRWMRSGVPATGRIAPASRK